MTPVVDPTGTLDSWFRRAVARYRDTTAIEVAGDGLTYGELDGFVASASRALAAAVGGRPRAVGLLASRSIAAYVGYLAALRCGARVVPLGVDHPVDRVRRPCAAAAVDVVALDAAGTQRTAALPAHLPVVTIRRTDDPGWPAARTRIGPAPDDVAYVLFTSGSTGEPKGVPIRHRQLAGYLAYCVERYEVRPGSRVSQTFDLTFDPSVFDMFVAWCGGATLVVPQHDELLTPVGFVNDRRITHWFSVPSVVSIAHRLRSLRPGCMPGLRWSLFAGEQLTIAQALAWAGAAPNATIENLYGPTELTITCTGYRLVRGPQRFDGYLNAEHDRGRFVRCVEGRARPVDGSPVADDWYRTGDRVRIEDGELVHLGRFDDQVKILGYRIELGEIESVLRRHPGVLDAVVLAVPVSNEIGLFAWHTGDAGLETELADLVRAHLPAYMLPQRFLHLDEFPDRRQRKGRPDRAAEAGRRSCGRSREPGVTARTPTDADQRHGTFRSVAGRFPTGVAVATSRVDGQPIGMTVNSFTTVSLDPTLLLLCLSRRSRLTSAIRRAGVFAVTVLAADQVDCARRFALPSRPIGLAAFTGIPTCDDPATGCTLLRDGVAYFSCVAHRRYPGGDHTIVLGEVRSYGLLRPSPPLLFVDGHYATLQTGPRFDGVHNGRLTRPALTLPPESYESADPHPRGRASGGVGDQADR